MPTRYALGGYQARRNALLGPDGAVDRLVNLYNSDDFPRRDTIVALLRRLQEFGASHFDFFYNGFTGGSRPALTESSLYPPPAVLATILFQISEDLSIIQRAADQRRVPELTLSQLKELQAKPRQLKYDSRASIDPVKQDPRAAVEPLKYDLRATLACADRLAMEALSRAKDIVTTSLDGKEKWDPQTTTLTYFEKSHASRVIPYAPVALIGIPLSCLRSDEDLLAVPHEVGHFVYHLRTIDPTKDASDHSFVVGDAEYSFWQQEIFADVFGARVAGRVMAYDFQELSNEFGRESFIDRDEKHPSPYLRPLAYTYALRKTPLPPVDWAESLKNLDVRWARMIHQRWADVFDRRHEIAKIWQKQFAKSATPDLYSLNQLREIDQPNEIWNADTASYLEQVYAALADLDFSPPPELPSPGTDVRVILDRAIEMQSQVEPSEWMNATNTFNSDVKEQTKKEQQDRSKRKPVPADPRLPFRSFTEWLHTAPLPEVTDLTFARPVSGKAVDIWRKWVRRQAFFGNHEPENFKVLGPGDRKLLKHPTNPPSLKSAKGKSSELAPRSWIQLWLAAGWTTEPPKSSPPGG